MAFSCIPIQIKWASSLQPQKKENEKEIYDIASKAYEDWMCCENDSEDWAIGDWVMEQLSTKGYEKEEDYYMFFDSDWD